MLTFLDLLVLVFMILSAVSLLALCLMFMIRKPIVRKICFYVVVLLGIYVATVGARIGNAFFPTQTAVAVIGGIVSVVALVLGLISKNNEKKFLVARILAAAALLVGICNAFFF